MADSATPRPSAAPPTAGRLRRRPSVPRRLTAPTEGPVPPALFPFCVHRQASTAARHPAHTGRRIRHLGIGCAAMSDEPVLTERRDGVLLITLNRPDARNAVNAALAHGLAAALDALDAEPDLTVGVITGAGKGFSAGMDLKAFVAGESPRVEGRGFAGIVQRSARKPLIAAIEGFAVAGGLEIALACDF